MKLNECSVEKEFSTELFLRADFELRVAIVAHTPMAFSPALLGPAMSPPPPDHASWELLHNTATQVVHNSLVATLQARA
jgi:hypothetical protein